jgi:hypothetical protein
MDHKNNNRETVMDLQKRQRNFYRLAGGVILVFSTQDRRDADPRGNAITNEMFKSITSSFMSGRSRNYRMEFVR